MQKTNDRYSRQEAFFGIGKVGQQKLLDSRIAIIGLGALGSASANLMARAGIGFMRIVDRDYVELSNLQRQVLYREKDAADAVPKAVAAAEILAEINSEIMIEPLIADVNSSNIDEIIRDVDLVIDASDNMEVRMLINEACHDMKKPWIFGGVLASYGNTMNILPGDESPCLRCLYSSASTGGETCSSVGVLGMLTSIISSIQCTEAVKILIGSDEVRKTLLVIDIWGNTWDELEVTKRKDCPVCVKGLYEYYGKAGGTRVASLCGRNEVQVLPAHPVKIDLDEFAVRWADLGSVEKKRYNIDFDNGNIGIKLFSDARAIIRGTSDVMKARAVYSEYIGL